MRILLLQGSPRKRGNTAELLDSFLQGVKDNKRNHIDEIYLNGMKIKPCKACERCRREDARYCVIKDDMEQTQIVL
jgi:multimeric flavodoxin WrbA